MGGDPDDALDLVGQAECFGVSCCGGEHPRGGVFFACGGQDAGGGDAFDDAPLRGRGLVAGGDGLGKVDGLAATAGCEQAARPGLPDGECAEQDFGAG